MNITLAAYRSAVYNECTELTAKPRASEMNRTNIYLTDKQLESLRRMAEDSGLSVAEIVRRTIDAMLEKEAKKERRNASD